MAWGKCWQKRQKTNQAVSAQIRNRTINLKKVWDVVMLQDGY